MAPVVDPKRVMDVATGTGIWALEYGESALLPDIQIRVETLTSWAARDNPRTHVVGTDLSLIQPDLDVPNCEFIKGDAEDDAHWSDYKGVLPFDYIHFRFVATCFDDVKGVMKHAFDCLSPGGYIEFQSPEYFVRALDDNLAGRFT